MKLMQILLLFISGLIFTSLFAADKHLPGLGGVAQNMMDPVGLFSDFVYTGCFVIGGSFLFASIVKYMEHRRSPLMVPISTVVFLLIAGLALLLLPFLAYLDSSGIRYSLFG